MLGDEFNSRGNTGVNLGPELDYAVTTHVCKDEIPLPLIRKKPIDFHVHGYLLILGSRERARSKRLWRTFLDGQASIFK